MGVGRIGGRNLSILSFLSCFAEISYQESYNLLIKCCNVLIAVL